MRLQTMMMRMTIMTMMMVVIRNRMKMIMDEEMESWKTDLSL